ncbi:MAG: Smr/MutS family protein [Desulfuromonadales bacterium]|nr:Smr/MutS family protein [Desulfuromonadales bacterium]
MRRRKGQTFTDPFGTLKGFRVSGQGETKARPAPPTAHQGPPADEETLFRQEMERLGVDSTVESPLESPRIPPDRPPEPVSQPPMGERELFLAALGEMETVFHDEVPAPSELPPVPRRMKLVRQGKVVPEAVLDLHGCDRLQALEKTRHFLENALWQGKKTILIVTGRGIGSGGEPVLRGEVERFLQQEAGRWVVEWGRAPGRYGGDGALVVFLRVSR